MKLQLVTAIGLLSLAAFAVQPEEPIEGKWVSSCAKEKDRYGIRTLTSTSTDLTISVDASNDANCSKKIVRVDILSTSRFGPDSQIVTNAKEFDQIITKVNMTPLDSGIAKIFNLTSVCGYKNWQMGVAKDVSGKTCGGEQIPKSGDTVYHIYTLAKSDTLVIGMSSKDYDGSTAEKRYRTLDTDHPMKKTPSATGN